MYVVLIAVMIAPRSLVVGSVGVVYDGGKSSLSATMQKAANELLLQLSAGPMS